MPPRSRPWGWPLAAGFAISALVHVLFLLFYPIPGPGPWAAVVPRGPTPAFEGTDLLRIVELAPSTDEPVEPPPPPEEEEEAPEVERRTPLPAVPGPPAPRPTAGGDDPAVPTAEELLTAAQRLRPRAGDPRLWAALPEELVELSDEQRMRLRLALELAGVADSMSAAAEAARASTDWTFTDSEGGRWGVSPGKIHLGDVTIPLPFGFSAPFDPSDDDAWKWEALERGATAAVVRESVQERGKAIRERVDRERAERRGGPVRPDTTRSGGLRRR